MRAVNDRIALVCAIVLSGCGGSGADPVAGPAVVSVGTGTDALVLLEDGDPIDLVRGPQGGVMVSLAVYASGLDPGSADEGVGSDDNPIITWTVLVDGMQSATVQYRLSLEPEPTLPTCFSRRHLLVQLMGYTVEDVDDLVGAPIGVELAVTDRDDRSASASVDVLGRDPLATP